MSDIVFSNIPPNLRVPLFYAEFDPTQAASSQPVQRTLIVGQASASVPATPVPSFVASTDWAGSQYGYDSQLTAMIAAYKANDPVGEVWALPLADAGGATKAGGSITIAGTASVNGTLFLTLAGTDIQVGVTSGQAAAAIATNVAAAITLAAAQAPLPMGPGTVSSGSVPLTATNGGTVGNQMSILLNRLGGKGGQVTPAGLTVTIVAMTGGATDPSLTNISTWLGSAAFDFIYSPYSDTVSLGFTSALMNDTSGRWSYAAQVYGHVWTAKQDTVANLQSYGAALNDQHLTVLGVTSSSPSPAFLRGAARLGASVPSLKAQPNRPLQTLLAYGVLCERPDQDIGFASAQALLSVGIALDKPTGSGPQCMRAVTTYQSNRYGQSDTSYLDTETMYLSMAVIRRLKAAVTTQLPRALLADDGTPIAATPNGDTPVVVTPGVIKSLMIADYNSMVASNWVERPDLFIRGLIVQRNSQDPSRVDTLFDPYYVGGLRVFAVLTQFHLQAQASQ